MVNDYNYSRLLGRIREKGFTQERLAKLAKMGVTTLSLSLTNKRDFRQSEIMCISKLLGIVPEELESYFFTH